MGCCQTLSRNPVTWHTIQEFLFWQPWTELSYLSFCKQYIETKNTAETAKGSPPPTPPWPLWILWGEWLWNHSLLGSNAALQGLLTEGSATGRSENIFGTVVKDKTITRVEHWSYCHLRTDTTCSMVGLLVSAAPWDTHTHPAPRKIVPIGFSHVNPALLWVIWVFPGLGTTGVAAVISCLSVFVLA